jgi:hypothetical protein
VRNALAICCLRGTLASRSNTSPSSQCETFPQSRLKAALKSDTLAIITFEIGLFAWMALMYLVFFPHPHLKPTEVTYWFMMQIGMVLGFLTSYPTNRWLIKVGWKAVMG